MYRNRFVLSPIKGSKVTTSLAVAAAQLMNISAGMLSVTV
jgi:hypothetical protein